MEKSTSVGTEWRQPGRFILLLFVLSLPLWVVGAVTRVELLPGLPIGALMSICPLLAASILEYRANQTAGMIRLLKRCRDSRRIRKVWYLPIVLIPPAAMVLSYGTMRLSGRQLPPLQFPLLSALALFAGFLFFALGEEIGFSGYAIDPMQERWGALHASLLLGLVWATWHLIPLVQAQRQILWIAGWSLGTVASRVLIVWLYNNTGHSVFAAALNHAMSNVCWQLFPIHGSRYDPTINGPILAAMAGLVVFVWGPRTLALRG